jgi:DNA repair exonuclease SbcCD ATPase subunit
MKKLISVLLLFSLLFPPCLAAQQASSLGEEIMSDLLDLNLQIESLQQQLEALEQNSITREQLLDELEENSIEKEQLLNDLEENRLKREALLQQLSQLVDQQAEAYRASLRKWKFLTISLGILSAGLAGIAIYQGASK